LRADWHQGGSAPLLPVEVERFEEAQSMPSTLRHGVRALSQQWRCLQAPGTMAGSTPSRRARPAFDRPDPSPLAVPCTVCLMASLLADRSSSRFVIRHATRTFHSRHSPSTNSSAARNAKPAPSPAAARHPQRRCLLANHPKEGQRLRVRGSATAPGRGWFPLKVQ